MSISIILETTDALYLELGSTPSSAITAIASYAVASSSPAWATSKKQLTASGEIVSAADTGTQRTITGVNIYNPNTSSITITPEIATTADSSTTYYPFSPYTVPAGASLVYTMEKGWFIQSPDSIPYIPLASGNILVGNSSGKASAAEMTGDVTIDNTGATDVGKIGGYSVSLGGAFTTGGAVTFSGAYSVTFNVPGTYTYTLPAQSGTLAELEFAQEFTAIQTFSEEVVLTGKSTNLLRITPSDDTSETVAYGTNAANDTVRWEILNNGSIRTASGSNSNFGSSDETDYTLQVSGTFYVTDTATVGGSLTVTDTATVGMASTLSGTFTATADGTEVTEVISGLDSLGCYLVSAWASSSNTDMTLIGLVNCGDANTIANVTTLIYNTYLKGSMSLGTYGGYTAFSYQVGGGLQFQIAATSTNSADVTINWSLLKIGGK